MNGVDGVEGIIIVMGECIKSLNADSNPLSVSTSYDIRKSTVSATLVKYSKESGEQPYGNKSIVFTTTKGVFETSQGYSDTITATTDATTGIAKVEFLSFEDGDATITAKMQDDEDVIKECTVKIVTGDVDVIVH